MASIFIDESGQFAKHKDGAYFVVASFIVGDPRRTNKRMRSWFRDRFPKKMRTQSEIKWSSTGIDERLRLRTIEYIAKLDVRIRFGYLQRRNIPTVYRRKGKIESGKLYTAMISDIIEQYLPMTETELWIYCDNRQLKGMTKQEFREQIISHILPRCSSTARVEVAMIDSTTNTNIQIADWIAGAISRYLENRQSGAKYYTALKNNLLDEGIEFFAGKQQ